MTEEQTKTTHLIVFYEDNWADEMDVRGFWLTESKYYFDWVKEVKENTPFPYTFCFGTNEEIEYDNADDLLSNIKIKGITEQQFESLKDIFEGVIYGDFPEPEPYLDEDDL